MQFFATAQPYLTECKGPRTQTTLLTGTERAEFVDAVGNGSSGVIPLCIDHAGGDRIPENGQEAFEVPGGLVIGRVVHAVLRKNGQLLIAGEIFFERSEAQSIIDDILKKKHRWGVSLCTNLVLDATMSQVHSKRITHVGVTREPEFGDENTWIHLVATNWPVFYQKLASDFVANEPDMYMSARLRELVAPHLPPLHVQAVASRHSASEPAGRLGAGREAGQSSAFPPPMSDAAAVAKLNREVVVRDANNFLKSLFDAADAQGSKDLPIDSQSLAQATAHRNQLLSFLKQEGIADKPDAWPSDIFETVFSLNGYERDSIRKTMDFSQEYFKDDPMVLSHMDQALQNPTLPDNLPYVAQVMASRKSHLKNQRELNAIIKKNGDLLQNKEEAINAQNLEVVSLKRKHAEAEQELTTLRQKISSEPAPKLARIDAPAPAAAPAQTAGGVMIDVGASKESRTDGGSGLPSLPELKNMRQYQPTNRNLQSLGPAAPSPLVERFLKNDYVTPWASPNMRDRINYLSTNNAQ